MARSLSTAARAAAFAQQTSEAILCLLTISGTGIPSPIRVVNNQLDIVSRGSTYLACAFTITLPDERDDAPPRVTLLIDNVDRAIVLAVRSLVEPPQVTLEVILASTPDTLEAGSFNFTLRNVDYSAETVSGELFFEDFLNEVFPADSFTPSTCPGLW